MSSKSFTQDSWIEELAKAISEKVYQSVLQWGDVVSKLGLSQSMRDDWIEIYKKQLNDTTKDMLDEAIENQNVLLNKIEVLLEKLETICKNLHIQMPQHETESLTLSEVYYLLESQCEEYEKKLQSQIKEIKDLIDLQHALCQLLDYEPKEVALSPLPTVDIINDLKRYIEMLENEKCDRLEKFLSQKSKIIELVTTLNYTPNLDFERLIISGTNSEFNINDSNMRKLDEFYEKMKLLKEQTEIEVTEAREKLSGLWQILNIDIHYSQEFLSKNQGINVDVLKSLNAEIERCKMLKMANIKKFIENLRSELASLWDQCHFTPQERENFIYIDSDLYTEDLLTLHDLEVEKMKKYYDINKNLYVLLEKRQNLWKKLISLENNVASKDRYKNRGGQLLQEEKERNALSKEIPKIEDQLQKFAKEFEEKYCKQFTSWGETIEMIISRDYDSRNENKILKLSAHKQKRDQTPSKSTLVLTPRSTQKTNYLTPKSLGSKRRLAYTPTLTKFSRTPTKTCNSTPRITRTRVPRFSIERSKREIKMRRLSQRGSATKELQIDIESTNYLLFESDLETKKECRSTIFKSESSEELVEPPRNCIRNIKITCATPNSKSISPYVKFKLSTTPLLKLT